MRIAITVCATRDYTYAMHEQAARVQLNLRAARREKDAVVILVGDAAVEPVADTYRRLLPGAGVLVIKGAFESGLENYQAPAQILIARMRSRAFEAARASGASHCWSLDSDVLPPANALRCSLDMLAFDDGYYGVAACPYPSQGGGDWLGGRGTPQRNILNDWTEEELELPPRLVRCLALRRGRERALRESVAPSQRMTRSEAEPLLKAIQANEIKLRNLEKRAERFPPKADVYEANSKGRWRRRGWLSQAYPAIGLGAVVPSDWCGFGCTLMGSAALDRADFSGYAGGGTEDLYIVWHRWYPAGIRIACLTHCPCDHIVRTRRNGKWDHSELRHVHSYHEQHGECAGHLRQRVSPWTPLS